MISSSWTKDMNCCVQKSAADCYPEWGDLKLHTHLFFLQRCLVVNKHSKTINFLNYIQIISLYRAVNTLRVGYEKQSVNAELRNNRSLFSDPHKTHK